MKERRRSCGLIYLLLSVFFVCGVNRGADDRDSAVTAKDARCVVREVLARNGLKEGFDSERKAVIEIVGHSIDLADLGQLNESVRFKAMEIAYLRAVSGVGADISYSMTGEEQKGMGVSVHDNVMGTVSSNLCARVMFQAESCVQRSGPDHFEYMAAIAVVSSEKLSKTMVAAMNGDIDGMPAFKSKSSLKERVDEIVEFNRLYPQIVHDGPKHFWILGTASQEVGSELDKNALRAKAAYAVECALGGHVERSFRQGRSGKGKVFEESLSDHSYHFLYREDDDGDDGDDAYNEIFMRIKLVPFLRVNPLSEKIKWFERDKENPMTGKKIRIAVAAIDSNDIPSFVRNGSSNATAETRQESSSSAIEQAEEFIESKGWRTGREFLKTSRFAVAIGGAAFKYTPSMDGAAFAPKRNDAVRQALLESAMNVAFTFNYVVSELKESLSDNGSVTQRTSASVVNAKGEKIVQSGISFGDGIETEFVLRSEGFKWVASFSSLSAESSERERASVKKVEGIVKSEMPIHGLKVERQFESIVDGVYQIAFVVTCDPERGRDMVLSFAKEKSREERGKLPLGQWIAEQDFGMMAGPRQYVDDKGDVWMIGIAPAAEGCRPFGSSLDGMAREYAAFGLSGDVKASYAISSLKGPSGEYSERKAEILYSAESSPTGKYYPKEFELVFHRAFTHPLTGRKGEVSICALRSGTKELVDKLRAEQIIEKHARAKEQERKKGIRDSLLKKEKGQFQ